MKRNYYVLFSIFTLILLFRGFFVSDAYAYLDPASGSVMIQLLIGALAGVTISIKIYWYRIKEKLSKN